MVLKRKVEGSRMVSYITQWLSIRIRGCYTIFYVKSFLPNEIAMTVMVNKLTDLMMPAESRASN